MTDVNDEKESESLLNARETTRAQVNPRDQRLSPHDSSQSQDRRTPTIEEEPSDSDKLL